MIIGGGPAGLTASLYAGRAGHNVVLFEKMFVGGQAVTTYEIENYPGVPAVSGPELVQKMEEQTKLFGVTTIHEEVTGLSLEGDVKTVTTKMCIRDSNTPSALAARCTCERWSAGII